jgi:putative glycosyltransferase (TIGR04372 family)
MVIEVSGAFLELHHAAARIEATWRELCIPRYHPIITMPKDLIERGRERIARDGVRDWFVGMHLRQGGPHDEDSVRNVADEQTYAPAVEFIRQAGGSVLRIGERPLARPIPGVVDYGGAGDWPDCFVISQSRFFLGTNSGPSVVAGTFGVPLLIANHAPAGGLFPYRATLVRKRVVERVPGFSDGRPLSTEAWQCKNLWTTSQLEAEGLRLVDCTAAEIVAGVAKMLQETS